LETLAVDSNSPVEALTGPIDSNAVELLPIKSNVDEGASVGVTARKGALASYITAVVSDNGFVEGNPFSAVIRFVTSGTNSATLISSSRLPEFGVSAESSPKTASTEYETVVGDADVEVDVHVISSKVIKGVRSKISTMYSSMCAHVTILAI
jgi:hypothetical protein